MCVGIYIPKDVVPTIDPEIFRSSHISNPDGFGILWNDTHLAYTKGCLDFQTFLWRFQLPKLSNSPIVLHFRTASASAIGKKHCHPFFVNKDLGFVHNGNFFDFTSQHPNYYDKKDGMSDTERFNNEVLKRLPKNFLYRSDIRNALETYCKRNMSKMIFMDSNSLVTLINQEAGEWRNGIYYSNGGIEGYIGYGYSGAYYYKEGDIRHPGGLPCVQMFDAKERRTWKKCSQCEGYFKNLFEGICDGCRTLNNLTKYCK